MNGRTLLQKMAQKLTDVEQAVSEKAIGRTLFGKARPNWVSETFMQTVSRGKVMKL